MMLRENKRAVTLKKIEDYKKASMRIKRAWLLCFRYAFFMRFNRQKKIVFLSNHQIFSKLRISLITAIVNGELSICGFYQLILQLHSTTLQAIIFKLFFCSHQLRALIHGKIELNFVEE